MMRYFAWSNSYLSSSSVSGFMQIQRITEKLIIEFFICKKLHNWVSKVTGKTVKVMWTYVLERLRSLRLEVFCHGCSRHHCIMFVLITPRQSTIRRQWPEKVIWIIILYGSNLHFIQDISKDLRLSQYVKCFNL